MAEKNRPKTKTKQKNEKRKTTIDQYDKKGQAKRKIKTMKKTKKEKKNRRGQGGEIRKAGRGHRERGGEEQ